MRGWLSDQNFRSLLKNSSYLGISRVIAAIAAVATLAMTGRTLGVTMLGMVILIHSYAQAAAALTRFQSWQVIVRYGGQILAGGDPRHFKQATGFAFALDLASAAVGLILAIALLPLVGGWAGIPDKYIWLAMIYCAVIPTMGAATPSGTLRALDRFDLLGWQAAAYPIVRALLASIAFMNDAPFEVFVAIWFVTDMGGDLYLWFLSWRELRRRDLLRGIKPTFKPELLPGAWRFAIHVNLTSSLAAAWGPAARLVVGGLLGPASAALYRIAATFADAAQKPADLLGRAFYPEVMRMDWGTSKPWRLMFRGAALASSVALVAIAILVLGGRPLIGGLFGDDFLPAYPVLIVLVFAPLLGMLAFPLTPMLYALDRPDAPLYARIVGTVVWAAIVAPLVWEFGIMGAAAAFVIGFATMVAGLMLQLLREYRRLRAAPG
jgi:O-antigen/teichoic acid export membrane protein